MNESRNRRDQPDGVAFDLVEYLIVAMPDVGSLVTLAPALADIVRSAAIRILDLVVVVKDGEGEITALELAQIDGMDFLRELVADAGELLSEHDIGLASLALRPGTAGLILVTEDRWAEPLSAAAQLVGGQIIAGERIPAARVESALADRADADPTGA